MPKPFDASTKFLVELYPEDWLRFLKQPIGPTELVEADLSTVTAAGDRILRVNTVPPYAMHMEFQAGPDPELEERTWEYNVLYTRRLKIPVPLQYSSGLGNAARGVSRRWDRAGATCHGSQSVAHRAADDC